MAQPNVAREPSMEEILASIRRIIESNDPISEGDAAEQQRHAAYLDSADDFDVVDELGESFVPQMAANDPGRPLMAEQQLRPAPAAAPNTEPQEKAMSLADVAARVRAAAGRVPEPSVARVAQPAPAPVDAPAPVFPLVQAAQYAAPEPAPQRQQQPPQDARPAQVAVAEPRAAAEPVQVEPRPAFVAAPAEVVVETAQPPVNPHLAQAPAVPAAEQQPHHQPQTPAPLPVRLEETISLVSQETEAQVARSFGELADVFDGISRQSMEDMAREMLRPMLQEWLDDNLPRLVERMVREEIERVARGPRR
ncbi:PopZ family protein [Rhizobium oryzicola]|uniref:DUF2497 domain-containing protein n=1 Tax=Rhizobium oryzicola TaxID=1232668 RepID=A0ABT8T2X4_9HYPH|nr:DUF2497 domain-containing protein [Rhizobium oryzicola]MDO1585090.1 DUF2497 domain-containing protein [Rhizobium oryzicola]